MIINLSLCAGTLGMLLLLTAFALNLLKKIPEDSYSYIILNISGAFISTYYAWALEAYPFLILEIVWGLFAVYKLYVKIKLNR